MKQVNFNVYLVGRKNAQRRAIFNDFKIQLSDCTV